MKKLTLIAAAIFMFANVQVLEAQNTDYKWAYSISGQILDFKGAPNGTFFAQGDAYRAIGPTHFSVARNLASSLNIALLFSNHAPGHFESRLMNNYFWDTNLDVQYSFANDYILDQDSWFEPYLFVGFGVRSLNKEIAPNVDAGLGLNFWIGDNTAFTFQTEYNYVFDNEAYYQQTFGLKFRIGNAGPKDSDGDGVMDDVDKCPNEAGLAENDGCPETEEQKSEKIQRRLSLSAENIQFESGKDVIKQESYEDLDRLAAVLKEFPNVKVKIEGHTDNTGNEDFNVQLSGTRAAAVKKYLVDNGVDSSRMETEGFGSAKPISENMTKEGRAKNRRVEITLLRK